MKDFRLANKIRKIDQRIAEISKLHLPVQGKAAKSDTLSLRSLFTKVVTDIFVFMILGLLLGYFFSKELHLKSARCFLVCMVVACLACVKNITKIK